MNHTAFPDPDLTKYVQVIWLWTVADTIHPATYKWYNTTACSNTVPNTALWNMEQYNCMDVPYANYSIELQGVNVNSGNSPMKKLSMIVGTCEDLSYLTHRTDCVNSTFVRENLDKLYIDTKHLTSFFDFVNYNHPEEGPHGQLQMNRAFYRQPLSNRMYTKKIFAV